MAEDKSTSEEKFEEFKQSLNSGGEVETGEEDETSNQEGSEQDDGQQSEEGNTSGDNSNDDSEGDSDASDTSGEDGNEEGDSDNTGESQSQLEKSYSQFDVDGTDEGYLKRLERAYQKSSEEAIRLNHEYQNLKNGQPVQQPGQNDQAQQQGQQPPQGQQGQQNQQPAAPAQGEDPVVVHMRTQMNQQADKDLAEFRKEHPEIDTDPDIRENVNNYIKFYSQYSYQNEGRLPGMKESLEAAYKHFGYGDDKEEKVASQTKQNASQSQTGSKSKQGSSGSGDKGLTDLEKHMAEKMGRDPEKVKKQKQQAS